MEFFSISRISVTFNFDKGDLSLEQLFKKPVALINLENVRLCFEDILFEKILLTFPDILENVKHIWFNNFLQQKKDIIVKFPGLRNFHNILKGIAAVIFEHYLNLTEGKCP